MNPPRASLSSKVIKTTAYSQLAQDLPQYGYPTPCQPGEIGHVLEALASKGLGAYKSLKGNTGSHSEAMTWTAHNIQLDGEKVECGGGYIFQADMYYAGPQLEMPELPEQDRAMRLYETAEVLPPLERAKERNLYSSSHACVSINTQP